MPGTHPYSSNSLARRFMRAGLLAAAALAALPAAGARAVEPGLVTDMTWYTSHAEQDRTAAALKDLGSKWVRLSIDWKQTETAPGVYNQWWLDEYDGAIRRAKDAGQRVVIMVYGTPAWASLSTSHYAPPRDPGTYARFMKFLAARYAGLGIEGYEVWNEPNYERFWTTGPDASEYAALLKAAYPAIKAGDPNAKVVFAGPSTNDYRFVEAAYAAGAKGSFDVMGAHPYSCSNAPDRVERESNGRIKRDSYLGYREIRASMSARGDAKPIWFTEFGWSTASNGCGVSESTQAAYIKRALELAHGDSYVQAAMIYNFRNNYWEKDADEVEARFGLVRTDFSRKPSYAAFKAFATGSGSAPAPTQSATQAASSPSSSGSTSGSSTTGSTSGSTGTTSGQTQTVSSGGRPRVRVLVRLTAPGRRVLTARGQLLGRKSGKVTVTTYYGTPRGTFVRVSRRIAVARSGRFQTPVARFRRGRWRVQAALSGTSALGAGRVRLSDEAEAGQQPVEPELTDDGRLAPDQDGEAAQGDATAGGDDAAFGDVEAPGPLADGDYLAAGDESESVESVQEQLSAAGFETAADGAFGAKTEDAVRRFQEAHGLVVDGVVGRQTLAALAEYA